MVQFWRISVSRVCIFCQGNLYFCKLPVLFFGSRVCVILLPKAIILMNSDQLYLPKFS